MSKKLKLSLDDLKVQSYVTSLESEKNKLGGAWSNNTGLWQCTGCDGEYSKDCYPVPPSFTC